MFYTPHSPILLLMLSALFFGIGWGLTINPTTTAAITALPQEEAGIASGTFITLQEIGGTLGLAITGTALRLNNNFITGYVEGMLILFGVCALALAVTFFGMHGKLGRAEAPFIVND